MAQGKKSKATPKPEPQPPRFVKWIDDVGAAAIASNLGVGVRVVYAWRSKALGKAGYRPDPDKLGDILALAGGRLTASDVYPKPAQLDAMDGFGNLQRKREHSK